MAHLGAEIEKHARIDLVLLFLAVTAMATARVLVGSVAQPSRAALPRSRISGAIPP